MLAVGVRRSPDLVQSDESTRKLIRAFVEEVIHAPVDGLEHRVALVVAGAQDHAEQLASLADLACKQMDAPSFFDLVRTSGKFPPAVRGVWTRSKHSSSLHSWILVSPTPAQRSSSDAPGTCCPGSLC